MATLTQVITESNNNYVQTVFDWDLTNCIDPPSCEISASALSKKPTRAVDSLSYAETIRRRRSGCEHVGSSLAKVLGSYGIGIDALISEIERLKSAN